MSESLSHLVDLGFVPVSRAPVTSQTHQVDSRTFSVRTAWPAMGTLVSLTALGAPRTRVEEAVGRAFEEMHRLIGILSRFEHDSPVSALNADGRLAGPPPELRRVVTRALRYHDVTRGAFDISVAPLVNLFRRLRGASSPTAPAETEVREARSLVDARAVTVSWREIRFGKSGMGITLDGIAKGFIVDRMAGVLSRAGVADFLIDGGGDIRVSGANQRGEPWSVGVHDPRDDNRPADTVRLSAGAVATSGSYQVYFDADRRFHHIVDPGTGRSPIHCASATVVAPTAMAADALATSVFVMAPLEGLRMVESLPGCSCFILGDDGRSLASRDWAAIARRCNDQEE
jgi:thiamine biosynthesis lipoprotein